MFILNIFSKEVAMGIVIRYSFVIYESPEIDVLTFNDILFYR